MGGTGGPTGTTKAPRLLGVKSRLRDRAVPARTRQLTSEASEGNPLLKHALSTTPPAPTRHRWTSRTLIGLTLLGSVTGAFGGLSTSARAASAGSAPSTAPDLTALVARTAGELTDGTRRLEQSQVHLADLQARQAQARTAGAAATARALTARTRLGDIVGAQYRLPQPGVAVLVLAGGAEALGYTVRGLVSLDQVRGNQQDLLAEADGQRRSAQRLTAEADRLAEDAARERDAVAGQVAELGRRAQDASDQLTAAQVAQDQRAADAARTSRSRGPAAGPPPAPVAAGGSCGGGNLSGYPNGMLPTSALCPLVGTNGLVLRADAAAAFNRMAAAGGMPCAGNSYRSYAEQVALYRQKPSLAAVPGTSNHGWGVAVDFACGADSYGSPAYAWLKANGPRFGWTHPAWAEPGGGRPEPWHWEFTG